MLSMDVMNTLGELGVGLPTSEEGVKGTVEELKTKLSYYKENQVRVTQQVKPPRRSLALLVLDVVNVARILRRRRKIMRRLNGNKWLHSSRRRRLISLVERTVLPERVHLTEKALPLAIVKETIRGRIKSMETEPMI